MRNYTLDKKVLVIEIISLLYITFIFLNEQLYTYFNPIINTLVGVFTNFLTIPILFIAIPFGLGYSIYQLLLKKNKNRIIIISLILSIISAVGTATIMFS